MKADLREQAICATTRRYRGLARAACKGKRLRFRQRYTGREENRLNSKEKDIGRGLLSHDPTEGEAE